MCSRSTTADFLSVRVRFEDSNYAICCSEIQPDMPLESLMIDIFSQRPKSFPDGPYLLVYAGTSSLLVLCEKIGQCMRTGKKHDVELLLRKSSHEELNAVKDYKEALITVEKAIERRDVAYDKVKRLRKKSKPSE